jgi:hypothetical protein
VRTVHCTTEVKEKSMNKQQRLGKTLATIGGAIKPVLATAEAAADDQTGGAMRIEQARYERQILDFESEIRRRRDAMHAERHSRTRGSGVMEFQENQNVLVLSDMWTKNKPRWYAAKVTRVIPAVRLNDFRPDYEVKLSLGDRTLVVDSDHIKAVTLPGYLLGPPRQYGLRSYVSRLDKQL